MNSDKWAPAAEEANIREESPVLPTEEVAGGVCEPDEDDTESLKLQLEETRREADEFKESAARALADFRNYRTKTEENRARDRVLASEEAVMALLPLLDDLNRSLDAEQDVESQIYKGVSMIRRKFLSSLQNLGLKVIDASGTFDPSLHQAVAVEEVDDDEKDGAILEQFQCGYTLGDKVLRAASVKVGKK
jgi:molecular chaperone GrpE